MPGPSSSSDKPGVAVVDGERQIGAAGMVDADEGGVGDDVQALLAAIVGMRAPADVGEQAGRRAQPLLLRRLLEAERGHAPAPSTGSAPRACAGERERSSDSSRAAESSGSSACSSGDSFE